MRELKSEARNSNVNALSTPAVTCVRTPGAAKRHAYGILQCLLRIQAPRARRSGAFTAPSLIRNGPCGPGPGRPGHADRRACKSASDSRLAPGLGDQIG